MPVPTSVLAVLALASGAAARQGPLDARALQLRDEGLALAGRDDGVSMERALARLEEAARLEPRLYQARADRALVEFLLAAARREEGERSEQGAELARSGRELRELALDELRPLVREHAADPAVLRALAVYYGLEGDVAQAARLTRQARQAAGADPWLEFAELAARTAGADRAEAVEPLGAFSLAHPEMVRARMMRARALFELGRADEAVAALDELLALSPDHDRAKRLRATILAPPPARVVFVPAPADAPPPQPRGFLPRKSAAPR